MVPIPAEGKFWKMRGDQPQFFARLFLPRRGVLFNAAQGGKGTNGNMDNAQAFSSRVRLLKAERKIDMRN
jgi:hypothetical protein